MRLNDSTKDAIRANLTDGMLDSIIDQTGGAALSRPGTDSSGSHGYWCPHTNLLEEEFCNTVYGRSMIARRATELLPKRACRLFQGWEGKRKISDAETEVLEAMYADYERKVAEVLFEACSLGRLHGDAYVLFFWDDEEDLAQPFNPSQATSLLGAAAKSCHNLTPYTGHAPGTAEYYHLTINTHAMTLAEKEEADRTGQVVTRRVHRSRILHVPGLKSPMDTKYYRNGRNYSILEYLDEPLREWQQGKYAAIDMLKTHSLSKILMSNIAIKTMTNGLSEMVNRFHSILKGMKYMNSMVLDKDQEDAEFINRQYSGVDKVMGAIDSFLTTNSDIPSAFLLNDGSAFSEGAGEGARYELATLIDDYIVSHLKPALTEYAILWFAVNHPNKLALYNKSQLKFANALLETRHEAAEVKFKLSQSDVAWAGVKALTNEDIRTRWEDGTFNDEVSLTGFHVGAKEVWEKEQKSSEPAGPSGEALARNAATSERGRYTTPGAKTKKDSKETRKTAAGQKRGSGQKQPK